MRQERTARPATEAAGQTPPGARPNRGGIWTCSGPVARVGCWRPFARTVLEEWPHIAVQGNLAGEDRTRLTDPLANFCASRAPAARAVNPGVTAYRHPCATFGAAEDRLAFKPFADYLLKDGAFYPIDGLGFSPLAQLWQ